MRSSFLCATACLVVTCNAASYWVSKAGNDSNSGAIDEPWLTVGKAASTMASGDTVRVGFGLFNERVTVNISGTVESPIRYLGGKGTVVRGFNISTNYIHVINFEIDHSDASGTFNYPAIVVSPGVGVELIDNYIHDTDTHGIQYGRATDLIARGNTLARIGLPTLPANGSIAILGTVSQSATNVVFEYNTISYCSDYSNPGQGGKFTLRNNILGPAYVSATTHIDGVQPNQVTTNGLMEANLSVDNSSADNHFFLSQVSGSDGWIIRGNVTVRSKGGLDWSAAGVHAFYHNTFVNNIDYWNTTFQIFAHNSSIGNLSRNNIFYRSTHATSGTVFTTSTGGAIDKNYDLAYLQSAFSEVNGVTSDPLLVGLTAPDFTLTASSPAINAGGPVALAVGTGASSTALVVDESRRFWLGDVIQIAGSALVAITAIDWSTHTLTLTSPISWSDADPIYWEGRRDIGAFPYNASGYAIIGAMRSSKNVYTMTLDDPSLVRMVVFYDDGIPATPDYTVPFSHSASGSVKCKVYARFATSQPVLEFPTPAKPRRNGGVKRFGGL